MGRIATYPAGGIVYEAAWNYGPLQVFPPPLWTDTTNRTLGPWDTSHGRNAELDRNEASEWRPVLDNRDGGLDPGNPAGPYFPQIAPYKATRLRMPFGVNQLTADQASAGEASGLLGPVPPRLNVVNDFGYPLTIAASGSAFQGTRVYQAVLPNGATQFGTVLMVKSVPVIPKQAYSFQAQCRITSGNSVSTNCAILWYDNLGNSIGQATGTAVTITSGSSTWVQLSASVTAAPAGAYSAQLKVQIASGTLTGSTAWQLDGLQWENSATATSWQLPGTLGPNLLPQAVATGSASINPVTDSAANWFYSAAGSIAQALGLTAAPDGATTAVAWTTPPGTTSSSPLYAGVVASGSPAADGPVADCVQVTATQQYTFSVELLRAASADATIQVTPAIRWFNASGQLISVSSGSAVALSTSVWGTAVVTATAPAGAVWGRPRFSITTPASTTATNVIYATGWQFEQNGSASAWADPGPTFFAFRGAYEQFPQKWRLSGTWGESDAVAVDALAGLAQRTLRDPFVEEVMALGPNFFYQLNDPAGSAQVADTAGNRSAAPIENSPAGAGSLTLGNGVTANTPGSGFIGSAGTIATFANNPSQANKQEPETYVSLHKTTAAPGPPTSGGWSRLIAFRASSIPAGGSFPNLWSVTAPTYVSDQSFYQLFINGGTGTLSFQESGSNGLGPLYTSGSSICDGNWHLVAIVFEGASGYFDVFLDGARVFHDNNAGAGWTTPTSIATDVIGAFVVPGSSAYVLGWVGDAAHAIEFPFALTTAQASNLYNSWRNASSGESTGARLQRMLTWVGYTGPTQIDSGSTQSMGPATDMTGQKALDGAFAIAATENGNLFQANSGTLRFMARSALYNSSPVFVFGENQQNGEWPYEDVDLPTDPILTYNIIPVQQWSTGQLATAQDAASQQANYQRTLPARVVNVSSFAEAQSAAAYLLGRFKLNRKRCSLLKLHVSAIPGLARVAAQLEIGTRIRAMKRPPYRAVSAAIQFDGFVQKADWSLDANKELWLTVQASPADLNNYWTLAPLHTTLHAQAASGQNQASINALPDAAYNKLAQSLPQGQQFTFDPGTPNAETMTVAPAGVPSTSLGYTSATLTFTANFQFTHQSGAVVCEPLPQGYTDPATWDANSVLGAASTAVLSGGGSGTNNVTVGPLPDAATNPLGSNWNTGDQVTLSPGSGNAETMTILSVAATVPGYTSCQITFTANLAHSHPAGDTVCDPLPAGVNSPSAVPVTTRLSY